MEEFGELHTLAAFSQEQLCSGSEEEEKIILYLRYT
jgi:hypothetical protein